MRKIASLLFLIVISIISATACNFSFTTDGEKKSCKVGEEFVINVKLTLSHRTCNVAPSETKFKVDGMEVKSATNWKEEKTGVWTRKVKVKVLSNEKKKVSMTATRTCDKDGGTGTFSLEKAFN